MNTSITNTTIGRRDFLKLLGTSLAATLIFKSPQIEAGRWFSALSFDPQVKFGEILLRGTSTGRIQQSLDAGQHWQTVAFFGEHCAVIGLVVHGKNLFATLQVAGHPFWITTTDMLNWLTVS